MKTLVDLILEEEEIQNIFLDGSFVEERISELIHLNEQIAELELLENNIDEAIRRLFIIGQIGSGEIRHLYVIRDKKVLPDFRRVFFAAILTHHPDLTERISDHGLISRYDDFNKDAPDLNSTTLDNQLRFHFDYFLVRSLEATFTEYYTNEMQLVGKEELEQVVAQDGGDLATIYKEYADGIVYKDAEKLIQSINRYYDYQLQRKALRHPSFSLHCAGMVKLAQLSGINLPLPMEGVPEDIILTKCLQMYEMYFWIEPFYHDGILGYNELFEDE